MYSKNDLKPTNTATDKHDIAATNKPTVNTKNKSNTNSGI